MLALFLKYKFFVQDTLVVRKGFLPIDLILSISNYSVSLLKRKK